MSENPIHHYEHELKKLEDIIQAMESGTLPLEEALQQYEQGITLIKHCQQALNQAEQKIYILTRDQTGHETLTHFDEDNK